MLAKELKLVPFGSYGPWHDKMQYLSTRVMSMIDKSRSSREINMGNQRGDEHITNQSIYEKTMRVIDMGLDTNLDKVSGATPEKDLADELAERTHLHL
ncbi:hypothetical protein QQP08_003951 [Theobroma cacao]|nr:hypothetical protein QQP08_003951 [Theobroma cacao]